MSDQRVIMKVCDNPKCRNRREHSKIEPALGYHIGRGMMHMGWGGGPIPATFACSEECIQPAIVHMIDETRNPSSSVQ